MADQTPKVKEVFKVPGWVLVLISTLALFVGGAGWINNGLSARQDANTIKQDQEITQLKHEQDQQNAIIDSTVNKVSDLTTAMAIANENTKRLDRIEALVTQILQKVK